MPFHFGRCEHGGLWSKKKIENLDDFLNLRMRLMGHAKEDFNALGGKSKFSTLSSMPNLAQSGQIDANEGFSPHLDTSLHFGSGFNFYYEGWPKQVSYLGVFIKKASYESLTEEEKQGLGETISTYNQQLTVELAAKDKAALKKLREASPDFVQLFPYEVMLPLRARYQARIEALKIDIPIA